MLFSTLFNNCIYVFVIIFIIIIVATFSKRFNVKTVSLNADVWAKVNFWSVFGYNSRNYMNINSLIFYCTLIK